jgi:2-polyprenyl-3-methyl-5-hydroxy-6-metoxy-1,4-benzoquinol methylase
MKKIQRNKDVINGCEDLEYLHKYDSFPIFMGCMDQSREEDILVDMQWEISKGSGIIQLNPLLPLDILYPESHGSGNVGEGWTEHHKKFAKFIQQQAPNSVLEIGGAHGILSREYKKENPIDWTILEPNPSPLEGVDAVFVKGFFDDKFTFDGEIDTVIHSHVFEHVYYPNEFISHISNFLKEDQKLIFSLPNMEEMLKRKYTNCINFEHTIFLTEPYIDYLLSKHGFKQVAKKYFKDDHSIFYAYVKDSKMETIELPSGLYEYNKKLYLDYIYFHKKLINNLNKKIEKIDASQPIYLFGAHVFSQYLIKFGLNTVRILCLLDNDKNKQGRRLYGTDLIVKSPKVLENIDNPIVILRAGVFNQEISSDIMKNINSNTTFWE